MKLYEIAEAYRVADAAIDESGGEITPEIEAMLAPLGTFLEERVDGIGTLITEAELAATCYTTEANRLRDKATAARNKAARLREYLRRYLVAMGREKVRGRLFSARPAKAPRPAIAWSDSGTGSPIPLAFRRTVVELDGPKAYEAYKAGTLPDGFRVTFTEYLDLR